MHKNTCFSQKITKNDFNGLNLGEEKRTSSILSGLIHYLNVQVKLELKSKFHYNMTFKGKKGGRE